MTKRLNQCKIGDKVKIKSLNMTEKNSNRLMDMGLMPGTSLRISRVAPFKGPIVVKIRGFEISFRSKEAENIVVETF